MSESTTRGIAPEDCSPDRPTSVYRYYDRSNILIYVGITSRGGKRNREHNGNKDWWPHVARQEVSHFPTRAAALNEERELIRTYRPPFNRQHNPDHEATRGAYLASLNMPPLDAKTWVRAGGKYIPAHVAERSNYTVTFRTSLGFAPIAACLVTQIGAPATVPGHGDGRISFMEVSGGFALIRVASRRPLPEVHGADIRVRPVSLKDPISMRIAVIELKVA